MFVSRLIQFATLLSNYLNPSPKVVISIQQVLISMKVKMTFNKKKKSFPPNQPNQPLIALSQIASMILFTFQARHTSTCLKYNALSPTSFFSELFILKGIVVSSIFIAQCISHSTLWKDLSPVNLWPKLWSPRNLQKYLYRNDIFSFWLCPIFLAGPYKVYLGDL